MKSEDDNVKIANNILQLLGIKKHVVKREQINIDLFIMLYISLFGNNLDIEPRKSGRNNHQNIARILKALSSKVLRAPLSHIKAEDIEAGREMAISNLLEIFHGLAQCLINSRGNQQPENIDGDHSINTDLRSRQLRLNIADTDQRADQLRRMMNHSVVLSSGSDRQLYLHGKLLQLMQRDDRSLYNYRDVDPELVSAIAFEDDLTIVTAVNNNDAPPHHSNADRNDNCQLSQDEQSSQASNETYVVDSTPGRTNIATNCEMEDIKNIGTDIKDAVMDGGKTGAVRDAWAQVSRKLIEQRYENEFLDMLLDEGDILDNEQRQCQDKGQLLRDLSNQAGGCCSLSAFDEVAPSSTESHHQKPPTHMENGRSGIVRPVVRHLDETIRNELGRRTRSGIERRGRHCNNANDDNEVGVMAYYDDKWFHPTDGNLISRLLDSFPGLQLSDQTVRHLWSQAAQQADTMRKARCELATKLCPSENRVEQARKRQHLLSNLVHKQAMQQMRLRERQEERQTVIATQAMRQKQRQQSARARRYLDEFSGRMRARMVHKQAREEQVFRSVFQAALRVQRDRINEMRRMNRDSHDAKSISHQHDLDSLENYYRDRFSMLAESLRDKRKQLQLQDRSQEQALGRLKREMRLQLENDIKNIQESLVNSQHEVYFRELDGHRTIGNKYL